MLNLKIEKDKNSKIAFSTAPLSQTKYLCDQILKYLVNLSPYFAKTKNNELHCLKNNVWYL